MYRDDLEAAHARIAALESRLWDGTQMAAPVDVLARQHAKLQQELATATREAERLNGSPRRELLLLGAVVTSVVAVLAVALVGAFWVGWRVLGLFYYWLFRGSSLGPTPAVPLEYWGRAFLFAAIASAVAFVVYLYRIRPRRRRTLDAQTVALRAELARLETSLRESDAAHAEARVHVP